MAARRATVLALGVVVVLGMAATALAARIVFEDNPSASDQQRYGDRGLGHSPGGAGAPGPGGARTPSYAGPAATPLPPAAVDSEGRLLGHKKKKKKKKVICGLASLLAGRDAAGATYGGGRELPQHRAVRQTGPYPPGAPGTPGAAGDPSGRSYGSGLGLAGFVLGTLVGSKLGYGFQQQHLGPGGHPQPIPGPIGPTQTQTQVQQGVFPVVPVVPVVPAPVHEVPDDYDDVEDDPLGGGLGGGSLCDQLQNRPEPGPLDSHFPLLSGILAGGGGGGQQQRPLYRPPPPRPPHYGYYKPQHQQSLLYSYVKPWTDLFFK